MLSRQPVIPDSLFEAHGDADKIESGCPSELPLNSLLIHDADCFSEFTIMGAE